MEVQGRDAPSLGGLFSSYDVLGYLVPGGALLFFMYAYEMLARELIMEHSGYPAELVHTPLRGLTLALLEDYGASSWLADAIVLTVILGLAYVVGHMLATLSSLVVDRLFVAKGYGYPYELFLYPEEEQRSHRTLSRAYYRGLVFWLPLALLLPLAASTAYRIGWWPKWLAISSLVPLAGLLYVTVMKTVVSHPSRAKRIDKTVYAESGDGSAWWSFNCFLIERLFPSIYDHVAKLLARCISTRVPFSEEVRGMHRVFMERELGLSPCAGDTSNWWFPYIHVRARSPVLSSAVDNWLRLYAFARNLSAALFFAAAYGLSWLHAYEESAVKQWDSVDVGWLLAFVGLCVLLAITMLFRYYYIYAHYYSRFVLRAFVYICTTEELGSSRLGRRKPVFIPRV